MESLFLPEANSIGELPEDLHGTFHRPRQSGIDQKLFDALITRAYARISAAGASGMPATSGCGSIQRMNAWERMGTVPWWELPRKPIPIGVVGEILEGQLRLSRFEIHFPGRLPDPFRVIGGT